MEFVSFVKDENGEPLYENTWQYAILRKEWRQRREGGNLLSGSADFTN